MHKHLSTFVEQENFRQVFCEAVMNRDDFRHRRAKAGHGAERKLLLGELWFANNALDHAIIGHMAGDVEGERKKAKASADIEWISKLLLEITHPEKPDEACRPD